MAAFTKQNADHLRATLQDAVLRCSERCLYQSAKWYDPFHEFLKCMDSAQCLYRIAELSTSLPPMGELTPSSDTDPDSPMQDAERTFPSLPTPIPSVLSTNPDPQEAQMEARETSKYLLAKSYFDCREYDRCAAVFLPLNVSREPLSENASSNVTTRTPTKIGKGKAKETASNPSVRPIRPQNILPRLSQKSLFLALYARYLSGEKRRDEDSEMILGPADGGATVNKELLGLGRSLEGWFTDREDAGNDRSNQGWLEYLYGIVLLKGKSEEAGKKWLIRSVHLWPFNWGAWLELSELLTTVDDVSPRPNISKAQLTSSGSSIE